jgi:hypothetical protein
MYIYIYMRLGRMGNNTFTNLADRAYSGKLTAEEVRKATKEKLEEDKAYGNTVLYSASMWCGIEVVEAIINKGVDVNQLSGPVSIVIIIIYYLLL